MALKRRLVEGAGWGRVGQSGAGWSRVEQGGAGWGRVGQATLLELSVWR